MAIPEFAPQATVKADADHGVAGQSPRRSRAPHCYVGGIWLLSIVSISSFFYWVSTMVVFPDELNYGEGVLIWQAQHVTHLATAYAPLTHYPPYIVFNYTPLYHLVSHAVAKLTGDLLLAGRLASAFSTIGICLSLGWIVFRSVPPGRSRVAAITAAVFSVAVLCGLYIMRWAPLMRVDMLGLFLTLSGLTLYILARTNAQRYGAFFLFVAAIYTRQTLIEAPLACLVVAAILNLRQALKMAAFTAALGIAILAVLFLATDGQVLKHLFAYNVNRYSILDALSALDANILNMLPVLALACAAAFSSIMDTAKAFSRRTAIPLRAHLSTGIYRRAVFTFTVYLLLSGLVCMTVGKRGADINYFLEWDLSACALAGLFLARLLWQWKPKRISPATSLAYLLPILMLVSEAPVWLFVHRNHDRENLPELARNSEALVRILRDNPEPVMSEDLALLYKAGKQVPFEPAIVTELAATGAWDETPLVNMIRDRAFSVMIISDLNSRERYSPAVAQAIRENYKPVSRYRDLILYRPRRTQATP